ncbi:unnamed protein product [Arabidopsis thaliana]|uniref:At3g01325 n=2 Tax=Arabidopsis thaliana TaxID=3702 RepID=Q3EBD8_ARATH|nr:uncharacterized protein AT3G01325 [Arabidopsis thaliana]ABD57484.1 At3g01325 [Arabidopsis thaliana]AEE73649.1 Expressed protein [Arabidopsis thaliana]VYS55938.1 unnamed protein product [Arabidopsis thaliana]|eukprot:NP_974203.1 Expressed protein [Arabidopsis thaliana]
MELKQTKVMFFLVALILALNFRPSEAAPPVRYCSTLFIERAPRCYEALRRAVHRDVSLLTGKCCRAVFATLPVTCFLKLTSELELPMTNFRNICDAVKPPTS